MTDTSTVTDSRRRPRGSAEPDPRRGGEPEGFRQERPSPRPGDGPKPGWRGPTYYGRPQLKAAPFENWAVGAYIFLAGLSGASALVSGVAGVAGGERFGPLVRRARGLMALAPTIGSALLVWDLHTPKRFYNMLRVAKPTSPMSIGTWILLAFTSGALPAFAAGWLGERVRALRWLRRAADVAHAPAALSGMGLSVYTASLLSATSTPTWAAAPRALAVRFGASAVAGACAALRLGERDRGAQAALEAVSAAALAVELAAGVVQERRFEEVGVDQAMHTAAGRREKLLATGLGVAAPLSLLAAAWLCRAREEDDAADALATLASACTLAGGLALRTLVMDVGDQSATRPEISFRFTQPRNLPAKP
ncbi:MAG: polysulfide reductase NrfD [Caulobacteraceae bacterium]|nr:polysulfide reductase NrfD [Caulobacter sp.]